MRYHKAPQERRVKPLPIHRPTYRDSFMIGRLNPPHHQQATDTYAIGFTDPRRGEYYDDEAYLAGKAAR